MVTTVSVTDNLLLNVWKYLRFSQFFPFHVISKQLLCHLRRFFCFLWVLIFNYFSMSFSVNEANLEVNVFASPLTVNIKRPHLAWLPLEITHRGHTWYDYPWPWVSLTWLLHNLQPDFENSLYAFGQSEKRYWVECIIIIIIITNVCPPKRRQKPLCRSPFSWHQNVVLFQTCAIQWLFSKLPLC